MNAADATSAADSTLRAGRNAALLNPSRATAQAPRPVIGRVSLARNQPASHRSAPMRSAAPAPKNAPACVDGLAKPSTSSMSPTTRAQRREEPAAPGTTLVWRSRRIERLRCQQRPRRHAGHRAKRDEDAHNSGHDTANRAQHQRARPHVQLQPRRSHCPNPPRSESVDDELPIQDGAGNSEYAAGDRQDEGLAKQETPDDGHRIARGPQDADLAQSLLDTQLEEEHREHQRRYHQKEAEVREGTGRSRLLPARPRAQPRVPGRAPLPWHWARAWNGARCRVARQGRWRRRHQVQQTESR